MVESISDRPGVGIAVIVKNKRGDILVGKRTGSHAQKYSVPGGKLDLGETFEAGASREIKEEHGITIVNPQVIGVTNNLETFRSEGVHFISVIVLAENFEGEPKILEPDKCTEIIWCDPRKLPEPHFDASRLAVRCYLENKPYVGISK